MNTYQAGTDYRADAAEPSVALLQAVLHHLLRHSLLGCSQSAERAAWLLDLLADAPRLDGETRGLCERMSAGLCLQPASGGGVSHV